MSLLETPTPVETPVANNEPIPPDNKRKKLWFTIARYTILIALAVVFFVPIVGTFFTAFRTMEDISVNGGWSIPQSLRFGNLTEAARRIWPGFRASAITTVPAVIGACFIAALASYALSQLRFKGRKLVFLAIVAGGFIPIHIQLIPVFRLMNSIGLYDSFFGLILIHMMRQMSISVLILTNFFNAVPKDLRSAAQIDGATEFQIFSRVFLPLTRPALAALFIFLFTWIWNDLLWGLVLTQSPGKQPVTASILSLQGEYALNWPLLSMGSLLATLPTIIVFLAFQRHFIKGLTMGSVKG